MNIDHLHGAPAARFQTVSGAKIILLRLRVLAVPMIGLLLVLARNRVIDSLEAMLGLGFVNKVIRFYSTADARLLAWVGVSFLAYGMWLFSRRLRRPKRGIAFLFAFVVLLVWGMNLWAGRADRWWAALLLGALMVANCARRSTWDRIFRHSFVGKLIGAAFFLLPVFSEVLLLRPYALWLSYNGALPAWRGRVRRRFCDGLTGATLVGMWAALLMPFAPMAELGQLMFRSAAVSPLYGLDFHMYSPFDVAGIKIDRRNARLFITGDGLAEVNELSLLETGNRLEPTDLTDHGNQFFAMDPQAGRLFSFDLVSHQVTWAPLVDLHDLHQFAAGAMPKAGMVFMGYHAASDTLVLASEVAEPDLEAPMPALKAFRVSDAQLLYTLDIVPGYLHVHPSLPIFYVDHFRTNGVEAYDLRTGKLIASASTGERTDRMIVDQKRGHLLVAAPGSGRILVYDASTLSRLGAIKTVFGARSMQIDQTRDVLLVSSLLNNKLDIVELKTRRSVHRYRLGPWLRDIAVDPARGSAYVTSRFGIYQVDYAAVE